MMKDFTLAADVERNPTLAPAVRATEPALADALGDDAHRLDARWEYRPPDYGLDLVLRLSAADRQAEGVFRPAELTGNGALKERLRGMRSALDHNAVWRAAVGGLMADVDEWCRAIPGATVGRGEVELYEEPFGRYRLPSRVVRVGRAVLRVEPVSGWVGTPVEIARATGNESAVVGSVDLKGVGGPVGLHYLHASHPASAGTWVYWAGWLYPEADLHLYYTLDQQAFVGLARIILDD